MAHQETTETHCHCGADFQGSDHCPNCYCEQYEATCDEVYVSPENVRLQELLTRVRALQTENAEGHNFEEDPCYDDHGNYHARGEDSAYDEVVELLEAMLK